MGKDGKLTDIPNLQKAPTLSITYYSIFIVGILCMAVAGYFLIEGLSEFSGGGTAKRMLIVGGILFQITESVCFISAAALTAHSPTWRYILLCLGSILFVFSIAVMTLAQKTALQTGESHAQAIDEKRGHLRKQIASLDKVIDSYRFNAEKQSKSIYKDSRALGQDSLNRAAEIEEKKIALADSLYVLNQQRRQTSLDFFNRLEEVTGLPAAQSEFYFLVVRSLLLELCGIILMSFSANLRAYNLLITRQYLPKKNEDITKKKPEKVQTNEKKLAQTVERVTQTDSEQTKPVKIAAQVAVIRETSKPTNEVNIEDEEVEELTESSHNIMEWPNKWASPKIRNRQLKNEANITNTELEVLASMVWDLYEQKIIRSLSRDAIRRGLKEHCRKKISAETATILSKIAKSRQEHFY